MDARFIKDIRYGQTLNARLVKGHRLGSDIECKVRKGHIEKGVRY